MSARSSKTKLRRGGAVSCRCRGGAAARGRARVWRGAAPAALEPSHAGGRKLAALVVCPLVVHPLAKSKVVAGGALGDAGVPVLLPEPAGGFRRLSGGGKPQASSRVAPGLWRGGQGGH